MIDIPLSIIPKERTGLEGEVIPLTRAERRLALMAVRRKVKKALKKRRAA